MLNCKFRNVGLTQITYLNISPFLFSMAFFINTLSIIISLRSNSFILIWFSIEISIFRFIVILLYHQHNLNNSYVVKYFMFQALRSVALIISLCKGLAFHDILMLVSMIKLGVAPFHLWFIGIVDKLNLIHFFWIAVPQKIIPLRLVQILSFSRSYVNNFLIFRVTLASFHIVTQFKLLKMVAASSIYLTPWVLFCFRVSDFISWIFFFAYASIQLFVILCLFKTKIKADPLSLKRSNVTHYTTIILIMMIAGFPPRPLFFIKLRVVMYLFISNFVASALLLVFIARISMFNYLNIVRIAIAVNVSHHLIAL